MSPPDEADVEAVAQASYDATWGVGAWDRLLAWRPPKLSVQTREVETNLRVARAAIQALDQRRDDGWLPIDTAPKDGTCIIGGVSGVARSVGEMFWWEGGWRTWDGENHRRTIMYPNRWRPLPEPPKE